MKTRTIYTMILATGALLVNMMMNNCLSQPYEKNGSSLRKKLGALEIEIRGVRNANRLLGNIPTNEFSAYFKRLQNEQKTLSIELEENQRKVRRYRSRFLVYGYFTD